jgi:hypothetical protein
LAGPSSAQTFTWSGGTGTPNWSLGNNWGGIAPVSSATNDLIFTGSTQLATNQNNTAPFLLNNLTFDAAAGAFSVAGNELRFGGVSNTLSQNSANNILISAPVSFDGDGTIAGTGAGSLTLSKLTVRQGTVTLTRDVTAGALTLGFDGGAAATLDTGSSVLTLGGDVTFVQLSGFVVTPHGTLNGTIDLGGADRTFAGVYSNENDPFFDFIINAKLVGTGGFIKGGSGSDDRSWMVMNAQNTYTGQTRLQSGSERLYLTVNNALPSGTALIVENFTSLYLTNTTGNTGNVGFAQSVGSLSDGGTAGGVIRLGTLDSTSAVLTVGSDNTSTSFAGSITGGGSLVKVGTGTLILSGNGTLDHESGFTVPSTYSGGTIVNGGTLLVNGQTGTNSGTGTGLVVVNTGATLGGTGRVGGNVTVNPGGTIRGGASGTIGTLTVAGNLTAVANTTGNGAEQIQVTVNTTTASLIRVNGSINFQTLGEALVVNIENGGGLVLHTPYSRTIATATGGIFLNGTKLSNGTSLDPGTDFVLTSPDFEYFTAESLTIGNGGTSLILNFTPVPEPVTVLGFAAAGLGLAEFVRRRIRT